MTRSNNPSASRRGRSHAKKKVLLVDDHPVTRQGVASLINHQDTLTVCGEASNAAAALELIPRLAPDVAIVDISLPGTNGIELVKSLKAAHPGLPVLIMSMHDEGLYAERAIRAGARGYVMKMEANEKILVALEKVLVGEIFLSDKIKDKILYSMAEQRSSQRKFTIDTLSDRELEVFHLIGEGFSTRQIAAKLNLSVKTIDSYRQHLKIKLNLATGAEMVRYAIQWVKSHA